MEKDCFEKLLDNYWNEKSWYEKLFLRIKWKVNKVRDLYYYFHWFFKNFFSIMPLLGKLMTFDFAYSDWLMSWHLKRLRAGMKECSYHDHKEDISEITQAIEFLEWQEKDLNNLSSEFKERRKQYYKLLEEKSEGWWC